MQRVEVSSAVRPIYGSLGVKRLNFEPYCANPKTIGAPTETLNLIYQLQSSAAHNVIYIGTT